MSLSNPGRLRALTALLLVTMASQVGFAPVALAAPATKTPSLAEAAPPNDARSEIVDARTETSQTFDNHDGTLTSTFASDPIFYRPAPGAAYEPIELGFAPVAGSDKAVRSAKAPVKIEVAPADDPRGIVALTYGERRIALLPLPTEPSGRGSSEAAIDSRVADVTDAFPGIDLRVVASAYGVSTYLVVDARPAIATWTFEIDAPGLTLVARRDGSLEFVDATDTPIGRMPAPYAVDSTPDELTGSGRMTTAVSYVLGRRGERQTVTVSVDDEAWLDSAVYPIYVDPVVTMYSPGSNAYGDAHVNQGNPNFNYANYQRPDSPFYDEMWLGESPSDSTYYNEAYIKFNLTSLDDMIIDVAQLQVYPYHQYYNAPTATNTWLRQVKDDWAENTIKWTGKPGVESAGVLTDGLVEGVRSDFIMTAMVQGWVSGTHANYGLRLDENGNGPTYWKRLISSEYGTNASPRMNITYHTPAPPAPPSTPNLITASDSGSSASDNITNDTTPTFNGTAEPDSTVTLYKGISSVGTDDASATGGNWSITPTTALTSGVYAMTATATNADGTSGLSGALSVTIDNVAPTVSAFTPPSSPTSATSLAYPLTFSESVSGLAAGDLTITGTATGWTVSGISGSGSGPYTVTLGGGTAGTVILTLNLNTVSDVAGNTGPSSASVAATVTVDRTNPTVSAFTAPGSPTASTSLAYPLTFSESVSGLAAGDLTITGTATGWTVSGISGSGSGPYTVTLGGGTAGTVILTLNLNTVSDVAGNTGPSSASVAATVTVDRTNPTVSAFTAPGSPTASTSLAYPLTFSESVSGLAAGDLTITGTATGWTVSGISGSGSGPYTVTLGGGTAGTVILTLNLNTVSDVAGNTGPSSASVAATVTVDRTNPTVSAFTAPGSPTASTSLAYPLTFSESVSGLAAGDLTITGTATGWTVSGISGSGSGPYTVTLGGGTAGTVILTLNLNTVSDVAGNTGPSSASVAATVTATVGLDSYASVVISDDPSGYWRVDETTGETLADFVGDLDGTFNGSATLGQPPVIAEQPGWAAGLNGTTGYLTTGASDALSLASTGRLSLESWVILGAETGRQTLAWRAGAGDEPEYWVWFEGGAVGATVWGSSGAERIAAATDAGAVPAESPTHVVVTFDDAADALSIFVNGRLAHESTSPWLGTPLLPSSNSVVWGRRGDTATTYLAGSVDELATYPSALAPAQVLAHYLAGADLCQPGQPTVIYGSESSDMLYGTSDDDVICGLGGDDFIYGLAGSDVLVGGAGDDLITGSEGVDGLDGGDGADVLLGRDDDDAILGGDNADSLFGGTGNDVLHGRNDDDEVDGGLGDDRITGGAGEDRAIGDVGLDRIDGGSDADVCLTGEELSSCETETDPNAIDTDDDGVVDILEVRFGTNLLVSDTDGDGLTDFFETGRGGDLHLGANPDTDGDSDPDSDEDVDNDGLTASQEQAAGSDPLSTDTDDDGLTDADELSAGTDPALPDTDEDGLFDGTELQFDFNPLDPDTDEDQVLDGAEIRTDYANGDNDSAVGITGTGILADGVVITPLVGLPDDPSIAGQVGHATLVTATTEMLTGLDSATVTLSFDPAIEDTSNLRILTREPSTGIWLPAAADLDVVIDAQAGSITVPVEHFSPFVIVDMAAYRTQWAEFIDCSLSDPADLDEGIGDGIPDCIEIDGFPGIDGRRFVSDPTKIDSDDDGLEDRAEIHEMPLGLVIEGKTVGEWLGISFPFFASSDPSNVNSDADTDVANELRLTDLDEAAAGTDPLQFDTDGDGLGDATEVLIETDPLSIDTDGDGFSDSSELDDVAAGFDPLVFDDPLTPDEWTALFLKGGTCGDFADMCPLAGPGDADTVPFILGAIVSSFAPVVVTDIRDVLGSLVHLDLIGTGLNVIGVIPIGGDAIAGAHKVAKAVERLSPDRLRTLIWGLWRLEIGGIGFAGEIRLASLTSGVRDGLTDVLTDGALSRLRLLDVDDVSMARLIARRTHLPALAAAAEKANAAGRLVRGFPFLGDFRHGETLLRDEASGFLNRGHGLADPAIEGGARNYRIIDAYRIVDGVALESKVGFQRGQRVLGEIAKERHLMDELGSAFKPEWHFFPSDRSGTVGATEEIFNALDAAEIPVWIFLPGISTPFT